MTILLPLQKLPTTIRHLRKWPQDVLSSKQLNSTPPQVTLQVLLKSQQDANSILAEKHVQAQLWRLLLSERWMTGLLQDCNVLNDVYEKRVGKLVVRDFERRKFSSATITKSALESYATWKHFCRELRFRCHFPLYAFVGEYFHNFHFSSVTSGTFLEHGLPVIKSNQREGMTSSKQFLLCTRNAATFAKNPSTIVRRRYLSEN